MITLIADLASFDGTMDVVNCHRTHGVMPFPSREKRERGRETVRMSVNDSGEFWICTIHMIIVYSPKW